jgi:hypothetical protein
MIYYYFSHILLYLFGVIMAYLCINTIYKITMMEFYNKEIDCNLYDDLKRKYFEHREKR